MLQCLPTHILSMISRNLLSAKKIQVRFLFYFRAHESNLFSVIEKSKRKKYYSNNIIMMQFL